MTKKRINGLIDGPNAYDGKELTSIIRHTLGENVTDITPEQLAMVLDYIIPSNYVLRNHTIGKGSKFTFWIPGRNPNRALAHRPWQKQIIDDAYPTKAIIKSRQLGLSEVGVASTIQWLDTHSYAGVKGLYTFPTIQSMSDFVQTRLNPALSKDYYSTIINQDVNSIKVKQIRDAMLLFRTSSKPGSIEGVDVDTVNFDE